MHQTKTAIQWEQLVQRCRELGVSRKSFCEQEGLKLSTFNYWCRKLNRNEGTDESSITCVELALPDIGYRIAAEVLEAQVQSDEIRIPMEDGTACVKIQGSISLAQLARIVTACSGENHVQH